MKPVSRHAVTTGAATQAARSFVLWSRRAIMWIALLTCLGPRCAMAQAVAKTSQAPAVTSGEENEAANRKALEYQAGKNAAKLMLRSVPDKSSVRIDGRPVGKTPLLLIVQPGTYIVEMEGGPRMEYGRRQVDLLPKESREVALNLQPRYPAAISLSGASRR
jgi:hypothetical protein